jgi:hypothetical protein
MSGRRRTVAERPIPAAVVIDAMGLAFSHVVSTAGFGFLSIAMVSRGSCTDTVQLLVMINLRLVQPDTERCAFDPGISCLLYFV